VTIINHGRIVHDSTMDELKRSYATRKVADIRLNRPVDAAQLAGWEVLELTDQTCRIVVDADGPNPVSALGELLATLPVKDLEVASPPIEAVIRRIYGTGVDAGIDAET
jgi:ABC-2 type transport system ATP-binding protein